MHREDAAVTNHSSCQIQGVSIEVLHTDINISVRTLVYHIVIYHIIVTIIIHRKRNVSTVQMALTPRALARILPPISTTCKPRLLLPATSSSILGAAIADVTSAHASVASAVTARRRPRWWIVSRRIAARRWHRNTARPTRFTASWTNRREAWLVD